MENDIRIFKKPEVLQLFVRLLHGKTAVLTFTAPHAFGYQIKQLIFEATKIPTDVQRLICAGYQVGDRAVISLPDSTIHLLLRLRGGKGGFGSLLRGSAIRPRQKKTNNFESCRDINGRRLRQVNMEKRLEEWKMEEEERKLEKIAEEFIKKKTMKGEAGQKYLEEYREESARCVKEVILAVQEACGSGKRKAKAARGSAEAKRLKIWMGNRELAESNDDSDESSSDDEKEICRLR